MRVIHCGICGTTMGHKTTLGFCTAFMVIGQSSGALAFASMRAGTPPTFKLSFMDVEG